jgi:hypothetical protein
VRHQFLHRFPHAWPVEEFIKTYLKNKRSYARKRGYLTERVNQKNQHDEEEQEEEQEEEEERRSKGKGKEREVEGDRWDESDDGYRSDQPV